MTTHETAPGELELTEGAQDTPARKPSSGNSTLDWALAYARHGWPVFPLGAGTNRPALPKWQGGSSFKDARTDPAIIRRMWARFPTANIGIATGAVSGLYVIDVDPKNDGHLAFATLLAEHGPVPATPTVRTPSGGAHYYFRHQIGLGNTQSSLGQGVDTRGDGGYVAAAPSTRPDGDYTWTVHPRTPLVRLPDWLTPVKAEPVAIRSSQAIACAVPDRVLAGLVTTVLEAPNGCRNAKLFWSACRLGEHVAAKRLHLDEGAAALIEAARTIGLSDTEAFRTLDSALRRTAVAA